MSSVNVGQLSARFGLDPAEFLAKLRGVSGATQLFSSQMKREMKDTARERKALETDMLEATRQSAEKEVAERKWAADATLEYEKRNAAKRQALLAEENANTKRAGFASIMLASNAAGAGIPFPLARILSQQFPGITNLLSGFIGLTAAGVGLRVIVDIFDKITHKMDEAKRKEEDYAEAVQKTKMVIGEANVASEQRLDKALARVAGLKGDKKEQVRLEGLVADSEAIGETAKTVEKLSEMELKEARAKEAQMQGWAAAGRVMHEVFNFDSTLQVEKINNSMEQFAREFSLKAVRDQLEGTAHAAELLTQRAKEADDAVTALEAARADQKAHPQFVYAGPGAPPATFKPRITQEEIDAAKALAKYHHDIEDSEKRRKAGAKATKEADDLAANKAKIKDAAAERAAATKRELEAVDHLVSSLRDKAAAETAAGAAASVPAKAAAAANKEVADRLADAREKLKVGDITTAQFAQISKALNAATPAIREYELAIETLKARNEQTGKATEELTRKTAELNTQTDERIAALDEEAAGTGKVAAEQARNVAKLAELIPLQQRLQDLYDRLPAADKIAPHPMDTPTEGQTFAAKTRGDLNAATAAADTLRNKISATENPKIQAAAFAEELKKVKERTAEIAGAGKSPWAKIDAEVAAATERMRGLGQSEKEAEDQAKQLRAALAGEQNEKIGAEFAKLDEQVREAHVELALLSTGSPLAKLSAEAEKIGHEFGLDAAQIAGVRARLMELQSTANAGKAWEGVDALNAGGAKMLELQQQVATLQAASKSGFIIDDATGRKIQMSADALSAVHLRMREIGEEEDKLLLKTGGIHAGFQAWLDDLQKVESEGQFVYNSLTQATKGFEDEAAKSFMAILTEQRGGQRKLIAELQKMWSGYFANLAQMGIKHGLDKLLQPAGSALGKAFHIAPQAAKDAAGTVDLGKGSAEQFAKGPGAMFSGLGKGGVKDSAETANTTATTLNTTATNALTAKMGMSGGGGGGGLLGGLIPIPGASGGGGASAAADFNLAGLAMGTDDWAGGSTWVGEQGPEKLNLPRGSQVIPNDVAMRSGGGDTHITNDFRGAVVTDDLMRKSDAVKMSKGAEDRAYSRAVTATKENGLRSRSSR